MFGEMIGTISDFMYSYLLIIMLLAVGLYFTIRTRGVQLRLLAESIRVVGEKSSSRESVSAFQALMVSTASRVGTGNIVGVANAIAVGGYGAVFWMWIIALLGGASAFIESTLAQIYKVRDKNGGSYGAEEPLAGRGLRGGPDRHLRRGVQHAGLLQPDRQHVRIQLLRRPADQPGPPGGGRPAGRPGGGVRPGRGQADRQDHRPAGPLHGGDLHPDGAGGHGAELPDAAPGVRQDYRRRL